MRLAGILFTLSLNLMATQMPDAQNSPPVENQFLYTLTLTRGDLLKTGPTKDESDAVEQHYNRLLEYTKKGVVILAGRTQTNDETTLGIVIFRAASEDAAREFMNDDPAVQKRVMKATLFPFKVALADGKAIY